MSQWLVERTASVLESRTSRRSFILRTALAGSALTVAPLRFLLRPVSAGPCQITLFVGGVNTGNHTVQPGSTAFPIYADGRVSVIDLNNRGLLVEYERIVA